MRNTKKCLQAMQLVCPKPSLLPDSTSGHVLLETKPNSHGLFVEAKRWATAKPRPRKPPVIRAQRALQLCVQSRAHGPKHEPDSEWRMLRAPCQTCPNGESKRRPCQPTMPTSACCAVPAQGTAEAVVRTCLWPAALGLWAGVHTLEICNCLFSQ